MNTSTVGLVPGVLLAVAVAALVACGPGNLASHLAKPPELSLKDQTKCGVMKSQAEPLIVEWPSASRAQLEAKTRRGAVVVHYVGCEMRVLAHCTAPGKYTYTGTTRKKDRVVMKDADDLYANIPVGAAKFEATLARSGELSVAMVIVGRYEAERPNARQDELEGDCSEATHVVSALTVGAFDFATGASAEVAAKAGAFGAGGGADSSSQRNVLAEDGDAQACETANPEDKARIIHPLKKAAANIEAQLEALSQSMGVAFQGEK